MISPILGFTGERFDTLRIAALGEVRPRLQVPLSHVITTGAHWAFTVLKRAGCNAEQAAEIVKSFCRSSRAYFAPSRLCARPLLTLARAIPPPPLNTPRRPAAAARPAPGTAS